jgi:hypothetical protein
MLGLKFRVKGFTEEVYLRDTSHSLSRELHKCLKFRILGFKGLRFKTQGLGVSAWGFGIWGSGFRFRVRVHGMGLRV